MAVRRETLRLAGQIRIVVDDTASIAAEDLAFAWARAWKVAVAEWDAAADALVAAADGGRTPGAGVIARDERALRALTVTRALLDDLAKEAGLVVVQSAGSALDVALTQRPPLVGSQLPATARTDLVAAFGRVDPSEITHIVRRSTERITSALLPLAADATTAVLNELVRGVIAGANPNEAARRMVDAVHGQFDGGLTRATVIARTEILDAHRAGGAAWDRKNSDVLAGWQWLAKLDKRTCPSCWSKHGTVYDLQDDGPADHQQGRCARLPVVKPWSDLGLDVPELPSLVPDAQVTFAGLPERDQLAVMGAQRLQLLRSGRASWADLSQRRTVSGWRDSFAPTPVVQLAS